MLVAILAAVLYLALLICVWGFLSLATGLDVIAEPVGPLVGPVMAAVSTVLVFVGTMLRLSNDRGSLLPLVVVAVVYLASALVASVIVAFDRVDPLAGLLFFAAQVTGPFVPAAAIVAGLVVLVAPLTVRRG